MTWLVAGWFGADAHAGAWRIDSGRVAPWAPAGTVPDASYREQEVRFEDGRVVAPHPLGCEGARYEWRLVEPEGLFEGNLPAPAAEAARRLGVRADPVPTLHVPCDTDEFVYARTDRGDLLLGLDNVVWTLRAAPSAPTPASAVERLLLGHFTHDMAFTPKSVAQKRAALSPGLRAAMAAWFAAPRPADEVPAINGDPFTDSQEYPDRFAIGEVRETSEGAVVSVSFGERRVDYALVRDGERWLVDDVVDERGQSLRALLAE